MLLDDDFAHVRASAALAIGSMNADRRSVVVRLADALTDESPHVRTAAAMALERIGPDAKHALPALRAAIDTATNELPNQRGARADTGGSLPSPHLYVGIQELGQESTAQAAQKAIAAIEAQNR